MDIHCTYVDTPHIHIYCSAQDDGIIVIAQIRLDAAFCIMLMSV